VCEENQTIAGISFGIATRSSPGQDNLNETTSTNWLEMIFFAQAEQMMMAEFGWCSASPTTMTMATPAQYRLMPTPSSAASLSQTTTTRLRDRHMLAPSLGLWITQVTEFWGSWSTIAGFEQGGKFRSYKFQIGRDRRSFCLAL